MSKKAYADRKLKFETLQLHVGQEQPDPATDARAVPIYASSSYVFHNSDHAAARFRPAGPGEYLREAHEPPQDVFEREFPRPWRAGLPLWRWLPVRQRWLLPIQNLAQNGDHIVSANNIYGGSYNLLEQYLPDVRYNDYVVGYQDSSNFEKAIQVVQRLCTLKALETLILMLRILKRLLNRSRAHRFRWWWTVLPLPRRIF